MPWTYECVKFESNKLDLEVDANISSFNMNISYWVSWGMFSLEKWNEKRGNLLKLPEFSKFEPWFER